MAERREQPVSHQGPLAWAARNRVFANLVMGVLILGGLLFAWDIKQEVFPEVVLDQVIVTVPYPGASPEEVEQGVVVAVEEAVRGVDGVDEIRSTAAEDQATVVAELFTGADRDRALNDIESAVGRITSFPQEVEDPVVTLPTNRQEVISLIIAGDLSRDQLRAMSERARADLLRDQRISQVEVSGLPPPEISIEVPQENLRRYGLTLPQIARIVADASVDLPAGGVDTPTGELLVRINDQRNTGQAFENVVVISRPDGTQVTLGDIAEIDDGFRETDRAAIYNGQPAVRIQVFRVGEESPITVSQAVHEYAERRRATLPDAVTLATWEDSAEIYASRINLLLKNGAIGLGLVLLILGLFLRPRLAFWVTMGIATSFLGVFLFMPVLDVTVNMISLFAFILALGIVVDDAIVVGEATYKRRTEGYRGVDAAIAGVREVAVPVTFAVLTTVVAFAPMLFVPGVAGKFFRNIPLVVIPILLISLAESFFVLPAHLSHGESERPGRWRRWARDKQQRVADGLERLVERRYTPLVERVIAFRYITVAVATATLLVAAALVVSGRVAFNFFPKIEGDVVTAVIEYPFGVPAETTRGAVDRVTAAARRAGGDNGIIDGIYTDLGQTGQGTDPGGGQGGDAGSHLAQVQVALVDPERREMSARAFSDRWRQLVGSLPGTERLAFNYSIGPAAGAAISLELSHTDIATLRRAAERLAAQLRDYQGVFDVDDGFQVGKERLDLTLRPGARSLGLTAEELARQVRGAFYGAEAERQQRGRDELRVYVRRPERERNSEYAIENMLILLPGGGEIPLAQAAYIERTRAPTAIQREQGQRVVDVTGDVDPGTVSANEVVGSLEANVLPTLMQEFPGLSYELSGEQQAQQESLGALSKGLAVAFFIMYAMMAVSFRSYGQPLIVMSAIPFGLVGAMLGHMILGYNLSLVSLFGLVALAGVVVNDSLVLIAAINDYRAQDLTLDDALRRGGQRRFRPILLTSLTTFFGLAPMIFETSVQARFLIPMAISLGFGVLFVTIITLLLVPALYRILEDVRGLATRRHGQESEEEGAPRDRAL